MARTYLRDGRAPVPRNEAISALMSRIRGKDTGPERTFRKGLWSAGIRGYRLNYAKAPGRPDIAFVGLRLAVFVHGCFWHGCPYCRPGRPKSNKRFWHLKLDRNKERDRRKAKELRKAGWTVITAWECRLRKDPSGQVERVVTRWRVASAARDRATA